MARLAAKPRRIIFMILTLQITIDYQLPEDY
jgi:hypothetical protein